VVCKHFHGLDNQLRGFQSSDWGIVQEKVRKPVEVSQRSAGVDYLRQTLAFGLLVDSPRARARK
jgi:hypothetical protein